MELETELQVCVRCQKKKKKKKKKLAWKETVRFDLIGKAFLDHFSQADK